MSKIALYRKYRPKNFSEVYGQELVIRTLENAISNNSINHAYIFSGPRGSGKTSIAKIFARSMNCLNLSSNYDTCGTCNGCIHSHIDNPLDIIELDAASNNGINEIRNIINSVSFIPNHLKYKVYIIDEAHMLTTNSWNALLKTLEEPPKHVVFIFATTEYNKIPATIVSRCQRFDFMRLNDNLLNKLLLDICHKENISIDDNALKIIVSLADGAARDAISILDQLTSFSKNISSNDVNDVFGLVNIENKIELLNYVLNKDVENVILFVNKQYENGVNFTVLLIDMIKILFDKIVFLETNNTLFLKILDEKNINLISNSKINNLLQILNHFNTNLYRLSKSNDQLFEIQLILLQAISLNTSVLSNNSSVEKIVIKKELEKEPITSSNDIFSTKIKLVNIPKKEDEKIINNFVPPKPSTNVGTNIKIYNNFEEVKLEEKNNNPKIELTKEEINNSNYEVEIDYKDFFFRVANNNNNEIKNEMNSLFEKLQENRLLESANINKLLLAKKFLVCSKNGAVLLFENAMQSNNFNKLLNHDEINQWINNNFKRNIKIIGVDKNIAKEWTEEFKLLDVKDLSDVNNNKGNENTKNLILDILSE